MHLYYNIGICVSVGKVDFMKYTASIISIRCFFTVLQIEPSVLHLLNKWFSVELHPHSLVFKTGSVCSLGLALPL